MELLHHLVQPQGTVVSPAGGALLALLAMMLGVWRLAGALRRRGRLLRRHALVSGACPGCSRPLEPADRACLMCAQCGAIWTRHEDELVALDDSLSTKQHAPAGD